MFYIINFIGLPMLNFHHPHHKPISKIIEMVVYSTTNASPQEKITKTVSTGHTHP